MYKLDLNEGKYTIIEDLNNGVFKALRYGEEWRNLNGDKLLLALLYQYQELEEENKRLKEQLNLNEIENPEEDYQYGIDLESDIKKLYGDNYLELNEKRSALFYKIISYDNFLWRLRSMIQNPVPITTVDFDEWIREKSELMLKGAVFGEVADLIEEVEEFIKKYHLEK